MFESRQRRWTACRGRCSHALPLVLLLLWSTPPLAQGALQIPDGYKVHDILQPPIMMETPSSYTAFSHEDISLPCEATGNPTPTFRWVKDGEEFGDEHKGSGTLKADGTEQLVTFNGYYRCYASNMLGTAMTQTVRVIVEAQPVLQKQHKVQVRAVEGDSIVLTCNPPQSSTPPHIHWMDKKMVHIRQNDRVMVGLDGNLYFSNVLKTDSRDDYICNAQYYAARTILPESAVSLSILPSNNVGHEKKPSFFTPKGSQSSVLALRGQNLILECIPKGLPTPKVEWKRKDGSMSETSGIRDKHNRWLEFITVELEDDGEYECTASNEHGVISHSFTVTVEAAPYWEKKPDSLLYAPGETVRLECLAEGIPKPSITWSINGQPIAEVDDDSRRSVVEGVLILRDVVYADTAVYQCEATNKHGTILHNSYLYVVELAPKILSSDGVVYRVIEGGDILLHCDSFGSPKPKVIWEDEEGIPLLSYSRFSPLTNGTIKLSNANHEDRGSYICRVEHTNINITAHLEVFNQTLIVTSPQDVRVLRGTVALLDCGFYKDPQLNDYKVSWRKNGHELVESSPDDKFTIFENGTLRVTNVQTQDSAQYTCKISTNLDSVMASGSITVVARPDPPKDLTLTDVDDHSLTLSWIPGSSHNSPIIEFIVEVREEQHSEQAKWKWVKFETVPGDFNHRQLKLHPYCTYRFRVIAVNEIGQSNASLPSGHHSTPPAVPSKNPDNVRSESTDPNSLTITWDEMDKHHHNGQGFQYKVSWRKSEGRNVRWEEAYALSPPFHINNTGTYTPFEIKVQAVNSLGAGPAPEPEIGHSGEDKPEEAPTGVSTTVMNSTVRVKWNEARNVRGRLKGYKIYIRRLGPQGGRGRRSLGTSHHEEEQSERAKEGHRVSREVEVYGSKTSEEVTGLRLYSRYELTMTAVNSKGEGPHSDPHRFITPEGAPGPPASLRFESPSEKSLILYWSPPLETNGVLLGYVVQYQQELEGRDSLLQMIDDPSVTHIELDSLDPSSYYIFKVNARTAAGEGPPITRRGATLLEGVPPSNISISCGNTLLNLSWVPGERDRNHGFVIQYCRKCPSCKCEESEVVNSTQGFYSLTGLKPGSQYELEIRHGNETQWRDVTMTLGPVPSEMPGGFATQGWLIGLISAIVLLVLILLILCLIKRRKGGKYAVKDKEDKEVDSEARPMKDETFGEYRSLESDGDEKRSDSQPSLCGDSKLGSDDSLAEYGDSVDIQFNEDGSFIGQYSGRGPVPHGNESSGPASPVNAVPPPPIAPSMSSILNRPS